MLNTAKQQQFKRREVNRRSIRIFLTEAPVVAGITRANYLKTNRRAVERTVFKEVVMDNLASHMNWIAKYWHIITGISLATWWMLVRIKRTILRNYVTVEEMESCRDVILDKIEQEAGKNREDHNELTKLLITHIDK